MTLQQRLNEINPQFVWDSEERKRRTIEPGMTVYRMLILHRKSRTDRWKVSRHRLYLHDFFLYPDPSILRQPVQETMKDWEGHEIGIAVQKVEFGELEWADLSPALGELGE